MGFKKSELLEEVKSMRVDFPSGKFLLIDYRVRVMPYRKRKLLMENVLSIQASSRRMKKIQKELEDQSLGEVNRERLEDEIVAMIRQANDLSSPLVDYLGGNDTRPPAIAKWDLTDDQDKAIPITRDEIEDLDTEMLSFLAWKLLNAGEVGEAKGTQSAPSSPSELSGVPA